MKTLQTYIIEHKACSLFFESISKQELKDILNNKYQTENEKKLDNLFNKYDTLKKEFDEKSKKLLLNKEYEKASELVVKWNKVSSSINEEIKKMTEIVKKDKNNKHNKFSIFLALTNIYEYISLSVKNINKEFINTVQNSFGDKGIDTYVFGPVRTYINTTCLPVINDLIEKNIKETSNESILEDIENVIKYLKLDFLRIKDKQVKWNPQNIQELINKLCGKDIGEIKNINDLLDDDELHVVKNNK
jgi:hypothetical protein